MNLLHHKREFGVSLACSEMVHHVFINALWLRRSADDLAIAKAARDYGARPQDKNKAVNQSMQTSFIARFVMSRIHVPFEGACKIQFLVFNLISCSREHWLRQAHRF